MEDAISQLGQDGPNTPQTFPVSSPASTTTSVPCAQGEYESGGECVCDIENNWILDGGQCRCFSGEVVSLTKIDGLIIFYYRILTGTDKKFL